ncbi:acyl-CoA N-acyltransferase [Phascolomyces articulosus]|uniref:histone acetyltransferase n=1 Tax=Phascolomyces articulosus TaxID=60185 RepID=A0AAD5PHW3_9FUNG|nr:acyl-CoA N-acyltransferase [Phascolomyces articulosus]
MKNHNPSGSTQATTTNLFSNPNSNSQLPLPNNNDSSKPPEVSVPVVKNEKKIVQQPRLLLPRPKDVSIETLPQPIPSIPNKTEHSISKKTMKIQNNTAIGKEPQKSRKRKTPLEEEDPSNNNKNTKVAKTSETSTISRRTASPTMQDTSIERPRNIEKIIYSRYQIGTWYYSPYPSEYGNKVEELFICEHCLKYTIQDSQLRAHKLHCKRRKPPGKVIYQQDNIKIYEIDGREHKLYCQNLCLMSKLFLETKTLYYDVEGFTFYVLTEQDRTLDLFVGYFSKEKISYDNYNLACIMVLPPQQRKGYGRLLIELSYELSKHQGIIGSPEKPLSALGALGYRSFWASTLIASLRSFRGQLTIQELSKRTAIHIDDVIETLAWLGMLKYRKKKGESVSQEQQQHDSMVATTTSSSTGSTLQICIQSDMLENAIKEHHLRLTKKINPSLIQWKSSCNNSNNITGLTTKPDDTSSSTIK